MQPREAIQQLFTDYATAFNQLDFEKQARFFSDSFIMAGPKGSVSQSKKEFLQKAADAAVFYKSVGQTSARLLLIDETAISNEYANVKTHWGVTFQKTGDRPVEFDISYIVYLANAEARIVMAITHEDEHEAMQKLGLLKKEEYTLGPSL